MNLGWLLSHLGKRISILANAPGANRGLQLLNRTDQVIGDRLVQIHNEVPKVLVGVKALGLNVRAILGQNPVDVFQDPPLS